MNRLHTLSALLALSLPLASQTPAATVAYGASCYGLTLTSTLPVIGTTMTFTMTGITPGDIGFLGIGWAPTIFPGPFLPLPWDPGACRLHVVAPTPYLMTPIGAPTQMLLLPIPNDPALDGVRFYAQGFTVFSIPWWLSSNGLEETIGV